MTDVAFHWAPSSRRKGIARRGLVPGSLSRNRLWRPPFVCLSRSPAYALGSSAAQTPVEEPMDLWEVDLDGLPYESLEVVAWHDELRVYVHVPKAALTLLATHDPEVHA